MKAPPASVDFSRRFIPEDLAFLSHTSIYAQCTPEERLIFNQLYGCYFQEQIIFFERHLAEWVLPSFLQQTQDLALRQGLQNFLEEERRHSAWFHALNQRCFPEFYSTSYYYFIRVAPALLWPMQWAAKRPHRFPLFVWLMLLQEERSMFFARQFVAGQGDLEASFVDIQKKHLADEVDHVRWDEALLEVYWPRLSPSLRRLNVRLFSWMLREFFGAPKRAGRVVIQAWMHRCPRWQARRAEVFAALQELERDPGFLGSVYAPSMVPRFYERLESWPEFQKLLQSMRGTAIESSPVPPDSVSFPSVAGKSGRLLSPVRLSEAPTTRLEKAQ